MVSTIFSVNLFLFRGLSGDQPQPKSYNYQWGNVVITELRRKATP